MMFLFVAGGMSLMSGTGYERWSRARASHGRSTSSTGSQSAYVGSREGDFGFSPDSGRGPGAALTGSFDPKEKSAVPEEVEYWSLTTLREKLVKIGAKVVRHGRYVTFQLAEVVVPKELFRIIMSLTDDLRRRPAPA